MMGAARSLSVIASYGVLDRSQRIFPVLLSRHRRSVIADPIKILSPAIMGWDMLLPVIRVIQAMFLVSYETGGTGSR